MTDRLTIDLARTALDALKDKTFVELFKHGSLVVEIYRPKDGVDRQRPHTRDEVYVVISGSGYFVNGAERRPFEAGEEFSEDFSTWVFFYGPEDGEAV